MAFIRNTDKLIEGSSKLFFSNVRAKAAVQSDLNSLSADISSEQSARASEDSGIKLRLGVIEGGAGVSGSIAKAQADAQAYADQKVAALVNSAPSVLDTLKELSDAIGGDASFASTIAGQIGAVDDKVDQEILDRQAAISQEASSRASAVSAEQSARQSADSALSGRIASLEADPVTKTYVDGIQSSLDSRLDILEQDETTKAYVDQQVAAEQSRAQGAEGLLDGRLDVLEQNPTTKMYVDGQVSGLQSQITQEISDRQGAVSSEASARQSADQALDGRLDVLESDPTTKTYVDGKVATEKTRAEGAESALSGRVASLEADPTTKAYVDGIQSALDGRLDLLELDPVSKTYVNSAKSDLQGQITAEVSARQSAVSSEASARQSADQALDGRLDVLELDPVSKTYVDGEVSDLQGQVNTEKGRVDAILLASDADKNSFAEIVSLINSVDTANDSAFAGYVLSNNAALAQEVSDRQSAVSSEASARQSADNALDGRLDVLEGADSVAGSVAKALKDAKEYADAGISSEASARSSADTTLQSNIDGLFASKSTTNLSEGSNLYHTVARAKAAAVVNSSAGSESDQAMSVSSAKSYIDSADALRLKLDGTNSMTGVLNFTGASGKNITWGTDGGGDIGASGANRPNKLYVKDTGYFGGFLSVGLNLSWASDGSGDIGSSTNFRPNHIYAKTSVTSSGKAVFTQSNAGAPGYTFGGSTNSGMYYDTNTVGLSVLGSASLTVTTGGVNALKPISMSQGYGMGRTAVAGNVTMTVTSALMGVTDTSAPRTITLPSIGITNRHFIIKDESGGASATNYIRIQPSVGQTVDGELYYDIVVPYESVMIYSNGTNWFIV